MNKFRSPLSILSAIVLTSSILGGCMPNQARPRTQQVPGPYSPGSLNNVQTPPAPLDTRLTPRAQTDRNGTLMREAQNIANALAGKQNIRRATVFVTDSTAYVAVDVPNMAQGQFTDQIKNGVANEVRRIDPSIQRVYVSADPDVLSRFQGYSNDIRSGKPIRGIYDRFVELTRRIFPQQR